MVLHDSWAFSIRFARLGHYFFYEYLITDEDDTAQGVQSTCWQHVRSSIGSSEHFQLSYICELSNFR